MAVQKDKKEQVVKQDTFGYYLYEGGHAHWQCSNLVQGDEPGFRVSEEEAHKPSEEREGQYNKLIEDKKKKEEEKKKREAAEKGKET